MLVMVDWLMMANGWWGMMANDGWSTVILNFSDGVQYGR